MNALAAPKPDAAELMLDVSWDDYLALPGVSITRLKELRRSPMHYRHRLQHPKESPALSFGRAAHCAVLEPARFEADHAVWSRRTASGGMAPRNGQWWEAFKAEAGARTILTEDEHRDALELQRVVRNNTDAAKLLASGQAEVTMLWSILGHRAKGRMDWLTEYEGQPAIVGLKSARDCRPFQFQRQSANLGYHLQWSYYLDGFKAVTGGQLARVFEIVVESEAPHAVVVYEIPDEVLQQGFEEYSELLEQLAECERTHYWPGPAPGIQILSLPAWVYGEEEISYVE